MQISPSSCDEERERIEIELLLEGIYRHYGYDFRNYAASSIRRRLWHRVNTWGLGSISALQDRVLHDPASMAELMSSLSVSVTEMFRDPELFAVFRKECAPRLRQLPSIRFWHAGCSTGEEVLSMAILLEEEGLLERARLYATDMNEEALEQARTGVFHLRKMREYTRNYLLSGGKEEFSEYYTVKNEHAVFHPRFLENVVFAQHNLATDQSFNEFHVIFCRNVLIYFNKTLQDRVHELFYDSLAVGGVLGLGNRESINFIARADCYETILPHEKLYRKVR
ncbi:CheR family methyltransferase [Gorillibacterium massiliense]|uniref:CheR family methyltransferase n=1 Tax=Gorillibacterium massiliense TaxID=1280390 RepID=UPI0004B50860|nr:protein-glutamate O-methyltransferase CheR [Gorillibacterium massiliense]